MTYITIPIIRIDDWYERAAETGRLRTNTPARAALVYGALRGLCRMRPWRRARPRWDYAAALVLKAATTGPRKRLAAAVDQMECALRTDNWL